MNFINTIKSIEDARKNVYTFLQGKITNKPTSTLCVVKDSKGRLFNAESDGSYNVGQTVLVKNGVIIAKTKKTKTVNHFNV